MWNRILQRFQNCSTLLQSMQVDFRATVAMFLSLEDFMDQMRDRFEEVGRAAKNIMLDVAQAYSAEGTRIRQPKHRADDSSTLHVILTGSEKFWVESFLTIINQVHTSLQQRRVAYQQLSDNFAFLWTIADNNATQLRIDVEHIISRYPKDLDANCIDEFLHFLDFLSYLNVERSAQAIMRYMRQNDLVELTFPNVAVALRIFLTLPVMVCEAEHSFLKMALIKNHLRSTLMQDKPNALAILSIESDVTRALNFESIIDTFTTRKKKMLSIYN
uniref:HAT C-terminal dimerisation domain-containing protein n=1 Tax=Latimeria chalumnae TaxID=7897 RepID=H2ZRW1_LATCH